MAPIRRYLRITQYSVLEVRIYLDQPSQAESWLLRRADPALPRIIQAVRPLVLPKLREENERASGRKGGKKKGVKDVVVGDDFEVSIFLTELSSRHSLLSKQKDFSARDKRLQSNSSKLTSWLTTSNEGGTSDAPIAIREEEDEDEGINLADIPAAPPEVADTVTIDDDESAGDLPALRSSRRRKRRHSRDGDEIPNSSSDAFEPRSNSPQRKRRPPAEDTPDVSADEKKKLALRTVYDGFNIYGRILCLVVKRRGGTKKPTAFTDGNVPRSSGQAMLENWVSTQAAREDMVDDEDG